MQTFTQQLCENKKTFALENQILFLAFRFAFKYKFN